MSLHLLLGRPGDLLLVGTLSLEILTNLPASMRVTCSSHSLLLLLSAYSLIGGIPLDSLICWLLILYILSCQLFFIVLSSHLLPTFFCFLVSALVSIAYVIIGSTVAYISSFPFGILVRVDVSHNFS